VGVAASTRARVRADVVRLAHRGFAIVTARWNARGTAQGHPIPEATRITLITVKDDGDRRLAGIHFSFIAGTADAPGPPGAS
jgi:hypothetical protein